jgi:hypothetical protein
VPPIGRSNRPMKRPGARAPAAYRHNRSADDEGTVKCGDWNCSSKPRRINRWKVYAPEHNAERVLLLLEAVAALVKSGREPRTMRWIARALLTQNLEARLPDDESLRGIPIRRYRARPWMAGSAPNA